jgi:hypothetical protein
MGPRAEALELAASIAAYKKTASGFAEPLAV